VRLHKANFRSKWVRELQQISLLVLSVALVPSCFAAHPQLLFDSSELSFIRAKVKNNTADWQALEAQCDSYESDTVNWPHATSGGGSIKRGMVVNHGPGSVLLSTGFHGALWDKTITQLGACYQAVRESDPRRAARYLAIAHDIITAMSQPMIKMVRQSDGMMRYAVSTDVNGFDLQAGAPPQVRLAYGSAVTIGDVWTVSGATGCTSLNGTWKVSSRKVWNFYFSKLDGSAAEPLNADCTLYSVAFGDYPSRFYMPALAKTYDWFYDGLVASYPADVANLQAALTGWATELSYCPTHKGNLVEENYSHSALWSLASAYIAVNSDLPELGALLNTMLQEQLSAIRDYREHWFRGGGAGEGWQAYGYGSVRRMLNAEMAMKMYGVDWSQPPHNFSLLDDTLQYFMEFTTPTKVALDDNEYVYPIGTSYIQNGDARGYSWQWFPAEAVYIPLSDATFYSSMANRFGSAYASRFQSWYDAVYAAEKKAAGKSVPLWAYGTKPYFTQPELADEFMWSGGGAKSSDWTTMPLTYRAWSGDYAVTRTDWSDTATEVTLLGGPTVGSAGNGKTQFNSGAITIQRGRDRLVVYGLGEASRSADLLPGYYEYQKLHGERSKYGNKKNSIWWAAANRAQLHNQGLGSRIGPPGQKIATTSWPSSIDRAEDGGTYTYLRANHLEANGNSSEIDHKYHQVSWTREIVFLRPKLVIVHDRTSTLNPGDERSMFWTFGRNIAQVTAGVPAGMVRYDASFRGVYRGSFTSVLPQSADVTVVDHNDLHFLFRAEVRPPAMDHTDDNWLAVFDTADSPKKLTSFSSISATNADAILFNDRNHTVVALPKMNVPALPITIPLGQNSEVYLAGLNPKTNYRVTLSGTTLTIAADDGTNRMITTDAGVLRIPPR